MLFLIAAAYLGTILAANLIQYLSQLHSEIRLFNHPIVVAVVNMFEHCYKVKMDTSKIELMVFDFPPEIIDDIMSFLEMVDCACNCQRVAAIAHEIWIGSLNIAQNDVLAAN